MRKRDDDDNKQCISPWIGLLVIVFVCVVLGVAVFLNTGSQATPPPVNAGGGQQVNYVLPDATPTNGENPPPMTGETPSEKILVF